MLLLVACLLLCAGSNASWAWVVPYTGTQQHHYSTTSTSTQRLSTTSPSPTSRRPLSSSLHAIPAAAASLLAGSIAGALGVGVAFPLDTIKTKAQVLAVSQTSLTTTTAASSLEQKKLQRQLEQQLEWSLTNNSNSTEAFATTTSTTTKPLVDFGMDTVDASGAVAIAAATATAKRMIPVPTAGASMMQVATYIYQTSGVGGFFAGVQTSMMGQAIIKAVVFAVNAAVLQHAQTHHLFHDDKPLQLLTAAALAGFVTSFLAAPVDRIKVLMQCADHECYHGNEGECVDAVLQQEGWKGFLTRGLGCTMIREIPAYSLYFGVYGGLQTYCTDLTAILGPTLAAALYGATAGCACWLPIYPIDVIRTVALNTEGDNNDDITATGGTSSTKSPWEVAVELYQTAGWEAFYDGLGARLLRQAVNHAVTFSVYEVLMRAALFQQQTDTFA